MQLQTWNILFTIIGFWFWFCNGWLKPEMCRDWGSFRSCYQWVKAGYIAVPRYIATKKLFETTHKILDKSESRGVAFALLAAIPKLLWTDERNVLQRRGHTKWDSSFMTPRKLWQAERGSTYHLHLMFAPGTVKWKFMSRTWVCVGVCTILLYTRLHQVSSLLLTAFQNEGSF